MDGDLFDDEKAPEPAPAPESKPEPTPEPPKAPAPKAESETAQKALPSGKLLMQKIFKKGGICKVTIRGWEGRKKLQPKDIGKKKEDVPDEIIVLGQKRLIKKSSLAEINSIESKARSLAESHSNEAWVGGLRFMTNEAFAKIKPELEELKKQYFAAADDFVKQYPALKEGMLKEFPEWAEKLQPFYPSPEDVRARFTFDVDFFEITIAAKEAEILGDAEVAIKDELAEKLNNFIKATVKDTRQLFLEELQAIKEKIDSGEHVHAKTVKKIQEMIEQAKSMDFVNDAEFMTMLDSFKKNWDKESLNDEELKKKATEDLNAILTKAADEKSADTVAEAYYRGIVL